MAREIVFRMTQVFERGTLHFLIPTALKSYLHFRAWIAWRGSNWGPERVRGRKIEISAFIMCTRALYGLLFCARTLFLDAQMLNLIGTQNKVSYRFEAFIIQVSIILRRRSCPMRQPTSEFSETTLNQERNELTTCATRQEISNALLTRGSSSSVGQWVLSTSQPEGQSGARNNMKGSMSA